MPQSFPPVAGLIAAAIGGLAVGIEREWSGHASGPRAHFAGVRTFTLLGAAGGLSGWLWLGGLQALAGVLLAGAAALVVVAYATASRRDVDGTTEVAAMVVLAAGVIAGTGRVRLASGVFVTTGLILLEKTRLHRFVERLDDEGLRAAARFAAMAVVVLPLLPSGPYGPFGGIRPRELWMLVLFFSGLSFAGYVAQRTVGARRGYPLAGLLGGLISSTSVTLTFSRMSGAERGMALPLAVGVVSACTVMFARVIVATLVLNPAVALALLPYLAAPALAGAVVAAVGLVRTREGGGGDKVPANPLRFGAALQMAVLFQFVLFAVHEAHASFGRLGVLVSGAVLGLTDVDALTISMARGGGADIPVDTAARAVAIGVMANTGLKLGLALTLGRASYRWVVAGALAAMTVVAIGSLWMFR